MDGRNIHDLSDGEFDRAAGALEAASEGSGEQGEETPADEVED